MIALSSCDSKQNLETSDSFMATQEQTSSGIYKYKANDPPIPFEPLEELEKIPLGGSVEDMLKYDPTGRLAHRVIFKDSRETLYYVSENRTMMGMDGLVIYWFDAL